MVEYLRSVTVLLDDDPTVLRKGDAAPTATASDGASDGEPASTATAGADVRNATAETPILTPTTWTLDPGAIGLGLTLANSTQIAHYSKQISKMTTRVKQCLLVLVAP